MQLEHRRSASEYEGEIRSASCTRDRSSWRFEKEQGWEGD